MSGEREEERERRREERRGSVQTLEGNWRKHRAARSRSDNTSQKSPAAETNNFHPPCNTIRQNCLPDAWVRRPRALRLTSTAALIDRKITQDQQSQKDRLTSTPLTCRKKSAFDHW